VTLYLDTSALLKRYVEEPDSERFLALIDSDVAWLTCRITRVEVWRNVSRHLRGGAARRAKDAFGLDWRRFGIVEVDDVLCRDAGEVAEQTGARSLDALHLASIRRAGSAGIALVTADIRQAQAARVMGIEVLGA
jgi:uncharacterized protein